MFCEFIAYLRSLAFKVTDLNRFSNAPIPLSLRWNKMTLKVHETKLTTKSEAATCQKQFGAAGFSEDGVSESFNLFQRTVEFKVNYVVIYMYNMYGSALKTFKDKTGKVIMEKCNIS